MHISQSSCLSVWGLGHGSVSKRLAEEERIPKFKSTPPHKRPHVPMHSNDPTLRRGEQRVARAPKPDLHAVDELLCQMIDLV